jgi:hypothetical protein
MNLGLMLGLGARCVIGVPIDPAVLFADGEVGGWYDPSDLSTLFQDSAGTTPVTAVGQPVGLMLDKSGNGNSLTQTTDARRPTLQEDSNGKLHLLLDGTDDFLLRLAFDFTATDELTAIIGLSRLRNGLDEMILSTRSTTSVFNAFRLWALQGYQWEAAGTSAATATTAPVVVPTTNVVTGLGKIATDTAQVRVNGGLVAESAADQGTGNYGDKGFLLGARTTTGPTNPLNARIYGLILRGKLTSGAQLAGAEAYMAAQSGVTL